MRAGALTSTLGELLEPAMPQALRDQHGPPTRTPIPDPPEPQLLPCDADAQDTAEPPQRSHHRMSGHEYAQRIESLEANDLDPTISMFGNGYMLGYPYVEALRIAAELPASANNPAGLNRANFILAVRAIDIHHPIFLDGITFAMNGNADAFPIEGTDFSRYDSSTHSWIVSNVIDVNGASGNCVWDKDNGGCR